LTITPSTPKTDQRIAPEDKKEEVLPPGLNPPGAPKYKTCPRTLAPILFPKANFWC